MNIDDLGAIRREICCPPFDFRIGFIAPDNLWIEASLERKDTYHPDTLTRGYGGKILIPAETTTDTIVKKFFVAARDYAEHEVREAFTYRGRRVLGPHTKIDDLWEIAI